MSQSRFPDREVVWWKENLSIIRNIDKIVRRLMYLYDHRNEKKNLSFSCFSSHANTHEGANFPNILPAPKTSQRSWCDSPSGLAGGWVRGEWQCLGGYVAQALHIQKSATLGGVHTALWAPACRVLCKHVELIQSYILQPPSTLCHLFTSHLLAYPWVHRLDFMSAGHFELFADV